jgi:hypothetical protein
VSLRKALSRKDKIISQFDLIGKLVLTKTASTTLEETTERSAAAIAA